MKGVAFLLQDERVLLAAFVTIAVLIVVAVVALARMMRSSAGMKRSKSRSRKKEKKTPQHATPVASPTSAEVSPAATPVVATVASKGPPGGLPNAGNVFADGSAVEADITRVTPFSVAQQMLPRLGEDDAAGGEDELIGAESKAQLQFESDAWFGIEEPTGPFNQILTAAAGQTDRGITRRRNEDAYLVDPQLQLYVVADGMGGYAGGDVAARIAVEETREGVLHPVEPSQQGYEDRPRRGRELIAAVERANLAVFNEARRRREQGMGTTLVAAHFSLRKQRVYIAHVGDSRVYRLRGDSLRRVTHDHTLAARGISGPLASNISRAVGIAEKVKVDLVVDKPLADDVYLLCSDGLSKMVSDEEIRDVLCGAQSVDHAVSRLILAANAAGGRDNITCVLVRVADVAASEPLVSAGFRHGGGAQTA